MKEDSTNGMVKEIDLLHPQGHVALTIRDEPAVQKTQVKPNHNKLITHICYIRIHSCKRLWCGHSTVSCYLCYEMLSLT